MASFSPKLFSTDEEFLRELIKRENKKQEIDQFTLYAPKELIGEHFATKAYYVDITFKDLNKKPKHLFIKKLSSNPYHSEMSRKFKFMEKESTFFIDLLLDMKQFCQKYKGCENLLDMFPLCLYGDSDLIVFENVVLNYGFEMLNKELFQDLHTAKVAVENLAQFHAVNFAFIENLGRDEFCKKYPLCIHECFKGTEELLDPMFNSGITSTINIIKQFPTAGSNEAIEVLKGFSGRALDIIFKAFEIDQNNPFLVLNHGDYWNNNMLFKKNKSTGLVEEQVFVDLQATRLGSPSLDLGYYFMTSVKPEVLQVHLQELVQIYFEKFEKTLIKFNIASPVNYQKFFEDFKLCLIPGLIISLYMNSTTPALKGRDMTEMGSSGVSTIENGYKLIQEWMKSKPERAMEVSRNLTVCVLLYNKLQQDS